MDSDIAGGRGGLLPGIGLGIGRIDKSSYDRSSDFGFTNSVRLEVRECVCMLTWRLDWCTK
jgi:hypothetical protein